MLSGRSTLSSLQEVLDDAAGRGTEDSDLCQRLSARLHKANAWSERATAFFAAVEAAQRITRSNDRPLQQVPGPSLPAAASGSQASQQQMTAASMRTPHGAGGGQPPGDAHPLQVGAAGSQAPPAVGESQPIASPHPSQVGAVRPLNDCTHQPHVDGSSGPPSALLQGPQRGDGLQPTHLHAASADGLRVAIQPHASSLGQVAGPAGQAPSQALSLSKRPELAELEALVTDGNLLGVKLDALGLAGTALADVRAWLKQVS